MAIESTVITHGLPYPENLQLAEDMHKEIWKLGVVPAMVAVLDGRILVGLQSEWMAKIAKSGGLRKLSAQDLAQAVVKGQSGGTTVAGTMAVAHQVGIKVFATGGIGGVHRGDSLDISADLMQLATTPIVVICSGAKAILDLPATIEYLETQGVPVIGYQTDEFSAFYSRSSGLSLKARADTAEEVVEIARVHWQLGLTSAVLVVVPVPVEMELSKELVDSVVEQANQEIAQEGMRGQEVTPYLLERVRQLTGGDSLRANLGLLLNNARVAGEIARQMDRNQLSII